MYKNSLTRYDQYLTEVNEIVDFMGNNDFWSEQECKNWLQMSIKDYQADKVAAIDFVETAQKTIEHILNNGFKNPQLKYSC